MASDKKTTDRGVVDSIRALREKRYAERGAGAKLKAPSLTTQRIDQLQGLMDAVPPTKSRAEKKAAKKRKAAKHGRR